MFDSFCPPIDLLFILKLSATNVNVLVYNLFFFASHFEFDVLDKNKNTHWYKMVCILYK